MRFACSNSGRSGKAVATGYDVQVFGGFRAQARLYGFSV